MMLCIDAGHGGTDSGCANGQYLEKNFTLQFAQLLKNTLNQLAPNLDVILTRNSDVYVSLENRCQIANSNNATAFVSIHINAGSTTATGVETLVYSKTGDTGHLANKVHNAVISSTGLHDRGVKIRQDLYVLKNTNMPAILVECGFIVADLNFLVNNYMKIVNGLATGIIDAFGLVKFNQEVDFMYGKDSIQILKDNNIITDVEYWRNAVKCVKYLQELLDNMAKKLYNV